MENNANDGLDHVAEARAAIADRLITPWWYLPTFGVLLAFPALGFGVGLPSGVPLCLVGLAGSLALTFAGPRLSGVAYSGSVRGSHTRWLWALLAAVLLAYLAAFALGRSDPLSSLFWVPAPPVVVLTIVLGRSYEQALRARLRAGR